MLSPHVQHKMGSAFVGGVWLNDSERMARISVGVPWLIYLVLFKTNEYYFYETRNKNKFEKKIMHRTSKFETSPYYSCVDVFERIPISIRHYQ